uniref:THUMP domain-containing protein n=1 Tax=Elaeophora elaphi TaxID=1147741 RepID=A0A0R3S4W5_9BILA
MRRRSMSSTRAGSKKHNCGSGSESGSGSRSRTILSEYDAEYACSDHAMVCHVVQTAVRNYFSESCTTPAHMTICIDFTEGAPTPSNSTSAIRYHTPLVQINAERTFDPKNTNVVTTATAAATPKASESPVATATEKVDREKVAETAKESPIFNAAKKLSAFTIKEDDEDVGPVKAITELLTSKIPLQRVFNMRCAEKKIAEKKVFEYLSVTYQKIVSQEMLMKWRKKYEEDKHALYSDQQVTAEDSSSSNMTPRSDTSISFHETGIITTDERMNGWGEVAGILAFEPTDSKGNVKKAIQIRGNLSDTM